MIPRLVLAELVGGWRLWAGAFVVCVVAALIALVCAGDVSTAAILSEAQNPSGLINHALVFGAMNVPVVIGALNILLVYVVRLQRTHHALWQFGGVTPKLIRRIVVLQVGVVGVLAFLVALVLAAPTLRFLLNGLSAAVRGTEEEQITEVALSPAPTAIAFTVFLMVVVGSASSAARAASRTPALVAVRAPAEEPSRPSRARTVAGAIVLAVAGVLWAVTLNGGSGYLDFSQILVIIAFLLVAPVASQVVMEGWTRLMPFRSPSWFLAKEFAHHNVVRSHAGISLLVVAAGIGVETGYIGLWQDPEYFSIALAIFGTPIALVLVTGAATIFMTATHRRREAALLVVSGGTYGTAVRAAVVEAVIFVITALILGVVVALPSALGPQPGGTWWQAFVPLPFVLGLGLALLLTTTVAPVLQARRRVLSVELARESA
ncbi:hypothetical protein [Frondihabitans cladoniiphilus]|uniref:ABC transport system permease protein n=1 Tax=Frondihabitans cladoniiphilus TaxID=715785 RepID=A0ABP8VSE3_9MICO